MKIRYKHQRFQAEAAKCVSDVFQGQPKHDGSRTFLNKFGALNFDGFGNFPLVLDNESICENVRGIQMAEGLNPVEHLEGDGRTFTIEMETGTGKTYTYIKTMYELNARYGWSKFVIVVPSIAIREGVFKSFESMAEHFAGEYGKRMQYFIYNSKQLAKIDAFASDNGIHAMIINTQAFNASLNEDKNKEGRAGDSAARIIFSRRDEFGSRKPIDILAKTNPILIIDEPQSVLGTDKSNATRKGIKLFNPLFTLLYSATHREIFNQVYRLDAIDAYNKKLVKKIEVRSVHQVGSTATNSYVYLDEIVISKGNPQARLGFDVKTANGTRQTIRLVGEGFDLKEQSGGLQEYANNFKVECIDGLTNTVHFLNGLTLHPGEVVGSVNEDILRRHQIRETIKTHLDVNANFLLAASRCFRSSLSIMWIVTASTVRTRQRRGNLHGCLKRNTNVPCKSLCLPLRIPPTLASFLIRRMRPKTFTMVTFLLIKKGRTWNRRIRKAKTKNVVSTLS